MNHLSLFVVGGGHIFVSDISVLCKSIESRIEVSCFREKIASAGVVEIGLQTLFDILGLEDLNDLLSLDDVPVRGIHTETVYCLIAVVVSYVERPHKRIMADSFCGRLDTSGTAVRTMKNTSYPKHQTMKLSTPVLTAAHRAFYIFFDILITIIYVLLGSMTGQM